MKKLYCLVFICLHGFAFAQKNFKELGILIKSTSAYSMFPDSLRNIEPRIYQGKTYSAKEHYNDSSFLVFIPQKFNPTKPYEMVIWLHGWNNNIDSTIQSFNLIEQFSTANKNALLVFVQGPKNAPDSYAGKFEQPNNFNGFLKDVITQLQKKKIDISSKLNSIVIAGHSGAYRAMSYITLYSNYPIKGILLFDALYSEEEKFTMYLRENKKCKFFNIYTKDGGTFNNSVQLFTTMKAWKWNVHKVTNETFEKQHQYLFVETSKNHTNVLSTFRLAYLWVSTL